MKTKMKAMLMKFGGGLCMLAMLMACNNVQVACRWITYQPDVPDWEF